MSEDPNKKPNKPPERFGAPRVEKAPVIGTPENDVENLSTEMDASVAEVKERDLKLGVSLENRAGALPSELQGEAEKITADAKAEIAKNEAELLAAKEKADRDIQEFENSWFASGEKMGGDGPIEETSTESVLEKNEAEKRQEVTTFVEGLKAMLADPELPEEERAEIQAQIDGFLESLAVAAVTGQTIYEPVEAAGEESITKVLPAKKEVPKEAIELKEKIDKLAKEIDEQGIRRAIYYGPEGYEQPFLGNQKFAGEAGKIADSLLANAGADYRIVKDQYPEAKPLDSLAYKLVEKYGKVKDLFEDNDVNTQAYFLSIRRDIQEKGARINTAGIGAIIPKELAIKINNLFHTNPKSAQALLLKLLPKDIPIGQMEELLNPPKYIAGESLIKTDVVPEPATAATPRAARAARTTATPTTATASPAPASTPTRVPDRSTPPPSATPDARPVLRAQAETSKSREELLAERRYLQREWEKEATKATERKMGKEEMKKYEELVTGRVAKNEKDIKKGRLTAAERKKMIGDVGFTDSDYQEMKAGSKPWTLNAIWKRLGELDREIVAARPVESVPAPRPVAVASGDSRPTSVVGEINARPTTEDEITIDEDAVKVQELADAAMVLNNVLSKLDQYFKNTDTETLEKIAKDPLLAKTVIEQGLAALQQWQGASVESVAAAMAPEYGTAEDIAKLSIQDLEAVKQHFIDKLIDSVRLAEHVPGTRKVAVKVEKQEKSETKDAMMAEISHAIKFDDAWYRGKEEETLKKWQAARSNVQIQALLKEKLWPIADDIKLLKSVDLDAIQEEVIEYLIPIAEAAKASAPSIGFAEKVKEHRAETLKREIKELMKKRNDLRQAVRRDEKGAVNKLRSIGEKLEKLRQEKREMKKE